MAPSTSCVVSNWLTSISRRRSVNKLSSEQVALTWVPHQDISPSQCHCFQDARRFRLCDDHYTAVRNPPQAGDQHHLSIHSGLVMVLNACPQCRQRPKHPDHRFCSISCAQFAASSAPELKCLPAHHELSLKVATRFYQSWNSRLGPCPKVLTVYMITWTEPYKQSFEQYKDAVEVDGQFRRMGLSSGNEQKRFRSTPRACNLGEQGNLNPCRNDECWLCETIRVGFEPHLQRKRNISLNGRGIRLGAGIYTSCASSKANKYAYNIHDPSSTIKAMLVCRVVIGKQYNTYREDPTIRQPPPGYHCVSAKPGAHSAFKDDEYVVYDADAIRAAYLVLYDTARGP